jgi:hypothetical protein
MKKEMMQQRKLSLNKKTVLFLHEKYALRMKAGSIDVDTTPQKGCGSVSACDTRSRIALTCTCPPPPSAAAKTCTTNP